MKLMQISSPLKQWLVDIGLSESFSLRISDMIDFFISLALIIIIYYIARFVVLGVLRRITRRSSTSWDDSLYNKRFFHKLILFIPGVLVGFVAPYTLEEFPRLLNWVNLITQIYLVFVFIASAVAFLNAVYDIYSGYEVSKTKPIKGYLQVFKIVIILIGLIVMIAILLNKSPVYLLGGLGAFSAVLLLIFKDAILGFVAGIQISANDMIRQGDWIVMNKSNADGEVIDISLTTVKVQNWDKTITTIPTYSLVSDSFTNWRGMSESGGRRIKRSVFIDINSVKFCSQEMIDRFMQIQILRPYIEEKEKELAEYNTAHNIDNSVLVNGRRQTNLGIFRAYVSAYLHNNPSIHQEMTFLVRQLQPGESGIPIEIYVFSREQEWAKYENLQSDIFDHLLAAVPEFNLRVFQNPSSADIMLLGSALKPGN